MVAIKLGAASGLQVLPPSNFTEFAILTGVGFTMSLFIGTLAFEDESLMAQVRLGVLVASVLSGLIRITRPSCRRAQSSSI